MAKARSSRAARRAARRSNEPGDGVRLETFLVACQKSLARAFEASHEVSRSEHSFVVGDRPLFAIDELQFDVSVGIGAMDDGQPVLEFDAPPDRRSRVNFRVSRRPMEIASDGSVQLANLDPLLLSLPVVRLRVTCVDDRRSPDAGVALDLFIALAGELEPCRRVRLTTDLMGRAEVRLDLRSGRVDLAAGSRAPLSQGDGWRHGVECYVWVERVPSEPTAAPSARSSTLILPIR